MKANGARMRSFSVALALLVLGLSNDPVYAEQVVEWRNVPIPIVLTVGEERVLAFPDHVEVGVPASLTSAFRTQSTGGTVLWLARQPFETQRLQVRFLTTGHVMLFDVTAVEAPPTEGAGTEPVRVVIPDALTEGAGADASRSGVTPVTLTRFAAQQLYAPARLLSVIPGIRRVPMGVPESIVLYRHELIAAQPLASWQGGGYFVTAVKLTNSSYERLILDPRELRGHFVTATFQHNSLGPRGSLSDITVVYLVTDRPFATAILAALLPIATDPDD
jgi:integrating conjugative element protein (TIGR03749 family)